MNKQPQQPQLNVDLKSTEAIKNADGKSIFQSGVILRRISKFVAGTDNDAIMPIPVFYDLETKKILIDSIPKDIREEYEDIAI